MSAQPLGYALDAFTASDIGCVRSSNQDSLAFVSPKAPEVRRRLGVLAVVADGMGGHNGGEVASAMAVDTICRHYFATPGDDPGQGLALALRAANSAIFQAAEADSELDGMGTTVTAMVLVGEGVLFAHVGDSRLYRCFAGQSTQLTEDDSLVADMVRKRLIASEQARHHPARNVLLRSLGTQAKLSIVTQRCDPLRIGDRFVLCSDGLWDTVEPQEIAGIAASLDAERACRQMIELARDRGGSDNISVIVIAIHAAEGAAEPLPHGL
ncbi:Stp1/IreP family PP2C-type Ser/Thr phosphatase [Candidatus Accumulibacter aalborgensis]|nr:Stp1/IreP family PP2C-type Ser/Thr phosphatase [Candidatus Accumulibacter aalborgensis]